MNLWMDIFQMVVMGVAFTAVTRRDFVNRFFKVASLAGCGFAGLQVLVGMGYVIPAIQGSM